MEFLGEKIDTKVAMLARLSRRRDADDLTWASLQDQEVANADEVAGDGDGVLHLGSGVVALARVVAAASRHVASLLTFVDGDVDIFLTLYNAVVVVMVVVVLASVDGMQDAIGGAAKTVAE